MRLNQKLPIALVAAIAALAACTAGEQPQIPDLQSTTSNLDYESWGTCRGTCTEETILVKDMSGEVTPATSYRCVDYEFSKVRPDSHIGRTSCTMVAQCIADGLCDQVPAIRPQQQWLIGPNTTYPHNAQDGNGTYWVAAKTEVNAPKQYFLYPSWFGRQSISTYTATQPPASPDVSAALEGKQPCPVGKERVHGTATCSAKTPRDACDFARPIPAA